MTMKYNASNRSGITLYLSEGAMGVKSISAFSLVVAASAALHAQTTARQLFYAEDPAPQAKTAAKAPGKTASAARKSPGSSRPAPGSSSAPAGIEATPVAQKSGPEAAASMGLKALGLRYSLLQLVEGAPVEVSPDKVFRSGDQVQLRVEGRSKQYLIRLWSHRSNLSQTPLGDRFRRCLQHWGLCHARQP